MEFLHRLFPPGSVAGGLLVLSLAVVLGLALGAVRVKGISLGVAAVLFSSLALAAVGMSVNETVLRFLRDFALIIFVYTIGLQMGPGFGASLKADGLRLNGFALAVLFGGAALTFLMVKLAHLQPTASPGVYAGGYATTPSLAAGQEAIVQRLGGPHVDAAQAAANLTSAAFAVAYPFGLLGPILIVIAYKLIFRINVGAERRALLEAEAARRPPITSVDIEITSDVCAHTQLKEHRVLREGGVHLSRLLRGGTLTVPTGETVIEKGDVVRAVGRRDALPAVVAALGRERPLDLKSVGGNVERRQLVVTHRGALGRTIRELDLINRFNVMLARVHRAGIELPARPDLALKFGDQIDAVGPTEGLKEVEKLVGNSLEVLNRPQIVPIFLGIFLGVIVGSIPLYVPGLGNAIKIGLAGGPMLAAILLSRLGNVGSVVWYMPASASYLFRDFGMAVFLACTGLASGSQFVHTLASREGIEFVAAGAAVTVVPMFVVGLVARTVFKMNFVTLTGLVAGAMTSSPTLLFANDFTGSIAPAVAYAAVYPLSMIAPVFFTQVLVAMLV